LAERARLPLTVGTAGHIDHGKTALVRALTSCDTDRLAEERRRGMSIELGFAELGLGERQLSLVDVPGHERFVRTMIAGASGVDMFLLVVAADDGPMRQTLEHLAVLHALGVEHGVLALSKIDLVEAKTRRLVAADAAAVASGLPMVEVSSRTGEGLEGLRAALAEVADRAETERRRDKSEAVDDQPVLHVDRVFTVVGHGTVVTGTLWSGRLQRGQRVTLQPDGREARIRSIQVHDRLQDTADSHQRVALNLAGVARDEVQRGDVVTMPDSGVRPTFRLDVELLCGAEEILAEPRVQVHLGTRDSPARVVGLTEGRAQLRLERPLLARGGDHLVVRRISPPDTLGGGLVLDPAPPRHGPGWEPPAETPGSPPQSPLPPPAKLDALARRVLSALEADGPKPRGAAQLAEELGTERRRVEIAFGDLAAAGEVVRAKQDVVYAVPAYEELAQLIVAHAERDGSIDIAEVRDVLGLSRKYAQALLEQLDSERKLRREGDRHFSRKKIRH
jgi:selenocysteine-specific elongation factor